jgi:hypothetical protein
MSRQVSTTEGCLLQFLECAPETVRHALWHASAGPFLWLIIPYTRVQKSPSIFELALYASGLCFECCALAL